MNVEVTTRAARLREPFATSKGVIDTVWRAEVALHGDDGVIGRGEATALPWYDGVSLEEVVTALEAWRPGEELAALPHAAAAIDLARWDLEGKRAGEPVWRLLGAEEPPGVEVNATIAAEDRAGAAAQARQARIDGFTCLKVKVGIGDDTGRLAAVRAAAGPEMRIRLDANGAWDVEEALRWLEVLAPAGIELCEEPVTGLEQFAAVNARAPVAVALDESAALPGALERRVADAICLKVMRCGGITGMLSAARRARALGYEVYLASSLDGPVGIAAAVHAAAVVAPERPCGLATLGLFEGEDPFPPSRGVLHAPRGPGLVDEI